MALIVLPWAAHQWYGSNRFGSTRVSGVRCILLQVVLQPLKQFSIWGKVNTACSSGIGTDRL